MQKYRKIKDIMSRYIFETNLEKKFSEKNKKKFAERKKEEKNKQKNFC